MLSSISPLGERARRQRFWITATSHLVASTAAGAALAGMLGVIGRVLGLRLTGAAALALGALAAVGAALDLGVGGLRPPGFIRQVDEDWLSRYRGWVYGAGYGAQLGVGFATIVTTSLTWLVFAWALFAGPVGGVVIGAAFGASRAVPLVFTIRIRDWTQLRSFMAKMQRRANIAHRSAVVVQAVTAAALTRWAVA